MDINWQSGRSRNRNAVAWEDWEGRWSCMSRALRIASCGARAAAHPLAGNRWPLNSSRNRLRGGIGINGPPLWSATTFRLHKWKSLPGAWFLPSVEHRNFRSNAFLKLYLETNKVVALMQKFLRCVGFIAKFYALLFIISNRHKYVAAYSMAIATMAA